MLILVHTLPPQLLTPLSRYQRIAGGREALSPRPSCSWWTTFTSQGKEEGQEESKDEGKRKRGVVGKGQKKKKKSTAQHSIRIAQPQPPPRPSVTTSLGEAEEPERLS